MHDIDELIKKAKKLYISLRAEEEEEKFNRQVTHILNKVASQMEELDRDEMKYKLSLMKEAKLDMSMFKMANEWDWEDDDDNWDDEERYGRTFASEGSALHAESPNNPRNLPCPTCGEENVLTPLDVQSGYQCDECADRAERGYD